MTKQKIDKSQTPSLPIPTSSGPLGGYEEFLHDLKAHIRSAQIKATLSVNRELILLYWQIGRDILRHQKEKGWGAKVIDRLAVDLRHAFPEMRGFSSRNLKYMRALAEAYPDEEFVQQVVAQIPWGHNVRILDYVKESIQREWYMHQTIENGWSRAVLVHRNPEDQPSVGIILCKGKNKTIAEYALRDMKKPMGVSEYRFTKKLPKGLAKELPDPRDLQKLMQEEK